MLKQYRLVQMKQELKTGYLKISHLEEDLKMKKMKRYALGVGTISVIVTIAFSILKLVLILSTVLNYKRTRNVIVSPKMDL